MERALIVAVMGNGVLRRSQSRAELAIWNAVSETVATGSPFGMTGIYCPG